MQYSENFLAVAAQSNGGEESRVATRLLEDVPMYARWELDHGVLMRAVASRRDRAQQSNELKRIGFQTLHRMAPFEYLRDRQVQGQPRRHLVRSLFGTGDYTQAILREHTAYLSSAASFFCTDSLCADLMQDTAFSEALSRYQEAYAEYYRAFCDSLLVEHTGEASPLAPLLPYLRYQLKLIREHILAGAPEHSDFAKLQSLYQSIGDTQKLPVLRVQ